MPIDHFGSIAPLPHLEQLAKGHFHLTLAHLYDDYTYRDYYRRAADLGEFVVIDNSSIELGKPFGAREMLFLAELVKANEIVVPDEIRDPETSTDQTCFALGQLFGIHYWRLHRLRLQLQVVPHGTTEAEWITSMTRILTCYNSLTRGLAWVPQLVVGLPKEFPIIIMDVNRGKPRFALELFAELARALVPGVQFHLLGQPRNWLALATAWPDRLVIRSTDTVKPIAYAMHGMDLECDSHADYAGRPADYFSRVMSAREIALAHANLAVFKTHLQRRSSDVTFSNSGGPAEVRESERNISG
jgi:hypothetical protein